MTVSMLGLRIEPNARNLFAAGTLAGFMGTTASIPGPLAIQIAASVL